jgi:hypothetical protein
MDLIFGPVDVRIVHFQPICVGTIVINRNTRADA